MSHSEWTVVTAAYAEHAPALFRYAARMTGSADTAKDVVQDTFVRLATRPPAALEDLRPWLFTVATNLAVDEARRTRRRGRLLLRQAGRQPIGDGLPDPATSVEQRDLAQRVRTALGDLSPRDRTALLLQAEGFAHWEIAAAIDTTTKSVGTILARALDKLHLALDLGPEDV